MLREKILRLLAVVLAGSLGVGAKDVTDDEYARFPKLYHLDDFETCLMQTDGVYCVGTFYVTPLTHLNPTYALMKEYSSDPYNYNHTLIHRGYCVSSRCPTIAKRNVSQRFEHCASDRAQHRGLRASLIELSYCRSHEQDIVLKDLSNTVGTPHRVFLYILVAIVTVNVIGTVYDVMTKGKNKSKTLSSWSLASNWSELMGLYDDGDPRLAALLPVEGFRVIMILLVVFAHAGCLHYMMFLQNTRFVEEMAHHPVMMLLQNGSSSIQIFIMLASFLLAQSVLSMDQPPSFRILPRLILKRIFRIAPVYLLVISFAATWWPLVRDGPLWPTLVGYESEVCKRKFWSYVFFLQNFIEPEQHCQWQTWFLAVDMQLYILGCIITVCLSRARHLALPLLGTAFFVTVGFNSYRAYIKEWKPLMYISGPDNVRTRFRHVPSFSEFNTSPMASLPSCLVGLFMAHLLHQLRENGFRPANHKWLIILCQMTVPLLPCWTSSGHLLRQFRSQEFMALYIALERPVLTLLAAVLLFGAYNGTSKKEIKKPVTAIKNAGVKVPTTPTKGFLKHIFSSRLWYPLGRMSLSVLMLHWCVNCVLVASRLTPITSTTLDMVADWITTAFLSYLLAVPVTLMIDIPFQKFYKAIMS